MKFDSTPPGLPAAPISIGFMLAILFRPANSCWCDDRPDGMATSGGWEDVLRSPCGRLHRLQGVLCTDGFICQFSCRSGLASGWSEIVRRLVDNVTPQSEMSVSWPCSDGSCLHCRGTCSPQLTQLTLWGTINRITKVFFRWRLSRCPHRPRCRGSA
jgi:hypothetical protein